ncbi:sugar ABC transporter ATP-binding protein [Cryptosporangium aurantiacum]|uniref:Monosaccharide ABC transporter ATP-binding protein, CUT2 family n=1 Tax=Cryptosporangium aurantiacum TaxID=134849 RepID=A0A1M7R3J7_9ACTN|nr:sugar ABC transporter ATP-binding protein [Cryptosporangium aurantiacum]SHN39641.1 monosaccharide ABC transporter ATP-binding protein, CUT2 family [Cryptosporangium aurantiacum]
MSAVRTETESATALSVQALRKVFPGTQALKDVDLTVRFGEVHALVGGNGCGKSTLIKILSGVVPADAGELTFNGRQLPAAELTARAAYELGFRVVHQDPPLYPDLSVAENIALGGHYPTAKSTRIAWGEVRRRASELIERFRIDVDPGTLVRDLPVSVRTQVAIATALQDVKDDRCIVALDEPTAALPAAEVGLLLSTARRLAEMGHAIVFISHRLDEVMAAADRVTVMRDGQVFAEHRTSELTEAVLIESILGRRADEIRGQRATVTAGEPILAVSGLSAGPVIDVSFEVRAGEILGVAGLLGSGRTELLTAIYGGLERSAGEVTLAGRPLRGGMGPTIEAGVVMIPEDRARGAAFLDMTVDDNMDIGVLNRYWRGLRFRRAQMRQDGDALRARFGIKAPSGSVEMRTLSGGNQQKTILARWLRRDASVLLLDEPSQGVDVGARADIYGAIRTMTVAGGAAVVVTSDLEELAQFVDRAIVLRNGRLIAQVSGEELTAHRLNELVHTQSGKPS